MECLNFRTGWAIIWWFLKTFTLPASIPFIIFKCISCIKYKKLEEKLKGRVVLITGASSGLGEALAHCFYRAGCKVILSARRENELQRVCNTLLQNYKAYATYPPVVLPLDLSNLDEVYKQGQNALSIYGHIDILINNAGISYRGRIVNTDINVDTTIMNVNYFGPVALVKAILPGMIERKKGHVVGIGSVQGLIGIPYRSAYAASKHALQAFHDVLRAEVAMYNIKVSVFNPGYIKTNLSVNALTENGSQYNILDNTTAGGMDPTKLSETLLQNITKENKELLIAPLTSKFAVKIRHFCPSFFFWLMEMRGKRLSPGNC